MISAVEARVREEGDQCAETAGADASVLDRRRWCKVASVTPLTLTLQGESARPLTPLRPASRCWTRGRGEAVPLRKGAKMALASELR